MNDIIIEKMTATDVEDVFEIESKIFGKTSYETICNTLDSSTLSYYVLKVSGKIIGFFEISIIPPEAEIFDIAIDVEFQGKGFGTMLIESLIETCKNNVVKTIFLEVNKINKNAIHLYEKFGFCKYGERENYYGKDDAILMKLELD